MQIYDVRDLIPVSCTVTTGPFQRATTRDSNTPTRGEIIDTLIALVQDGVAPDSWRDRGGTAGRIRQFNGYLIVEQTWQNHLAMADFLANLRAHRMTFRPAMQRDTENDKRLPSH